MTFIKDKDAYRLALNLAACGEMYTHIAHLYLRKAYGV